jgi:hypothetical protein
LLEDCQIFGPIAADCDIVNVGSHEVQRLSITVCALKKISVPSKSK